MDLLDLPPIESHEGLSLVPWLDDPTVPRDQPAMTTWHYANHSVRSERYRYIRYRDGGEELYDHAIDRGEHINLAADPRRVDVVAEHRRWLPRNNVNHSQNPWVDSYGERYRRWAEHEEEIPEWLR